MLNGRGESFLVGCKTHVPLQSAGLEERAADHHTSCHCVVFGDNSSTINCCRGISVNIPPFLLRNYASSLVM